MLEIFDQPSDQSVQTITWWFTKQHVHVTKLCMFFFLHTAMLSAESRLLPPFWVGWMSMACVCLCVQYMCVYI